MSRLLMLIFVFGVLCSFTIQSQTYNLVWEDNFDGTTLDSSKWNYEQKVGVWNTGANAELQHYKQDNVNVGDDGLGNSCLILTAKKESYNGYSFTSGKVTTKGKFAFKRGKMEAMIKMPNLADGLWPAFWTLGYTPKGWPDCGEIDVLEMGHVAAIQDGVQNSYIGAHLFWGPHPRDYGTELVTDEDLSSDYFKHTLIWDESKISVYFNDAETPYFSMGITGDDAEEFRDYQHYIILNMAVGGLFTGIHTVDGITAPLPANMYVDWVKVYQEEDKEDYNANLSPFGYFGVYEETLSTDMGMNLGFDLFEHTTGLTDKLDEEAYEGEELLAYSVSNAVDFELKLKAGIVRNMSNYTKGSLQLMVKTDLNNEIKIGVGDKAGNEKFSIFSSDSENNFARNGEWQLVYVPLSEFELGDGVAELEDMLIVKGTADTDGYIAIDQVVYKETVPAAGYYGIVTDNPIITEGFVVDNTNNNMYIWSNTVAFNEYYPAYEGENVLSFKSSGAEAWFGYGFHSATPLNFQAYANGYLNISIRTNSSNAFYIGMDGEGSDAVIDFDGNNDPYGFERDGEWQHLSIPVSDLVAKGLNLASINHVFKTGGGGTIGNIAYDNIYLSENESDIDNEVVCYANSISISPSNGSTTVNKVLKFTASVLNQFGAKHDNKVEWTADGGSIDEDGKFVSDVVGEFTVMAIQDNVSAPAIASVSEATGVNGDEMIGVYAFMDNSQEQLNIKGLEGCNTIQVYNAAGKLIHKLTTTNAAESIQMSKEQAGIYIVKVESSDQTYINKFLKR